MKTPKMPKNTPGIALEIWIATPENVIPVPISIGINSSRNPVFSVLYELTGPRFSPG